MKTHYDNAKGESKRSRRSDLLYDLQHGWRVYGLHAGDLGGGEAAASTASSWPTATIAAANVAQGANGTGMGPDSVEPEGLSKDNAAPVATGAVGMRDLPWRDFLHGEHCNEILAVHKKEFDGLTSSILKELFPAGPSSGGC